MNTQEEKPMTQSKTVLHHYLGTGLQMMFEKSGRIITLDGLHYTDAGNEIYISGDKHYESTIWSFKPALHSMNRLTMPLENGEIPILELARIAFPENVFEILKTGAVCRNPGTRIFFYYIDRYFIAFDQTATPIDVPCQLDMFQYLYKNRFNVHNLPESEYIEKSTLKL